MAPPAVTGVLEAGTEHAAETSPPGSHASPEAIEPGEPGGRPSTSRTRRGARRGPRLVAESLAVGVIAVAVAAVLYRVWTVDWSLPLDLGGDATATAATVKGVVEHGWFLSNPDLGAPFGLQLYDFPMNGEALQFFVLRLLGLVGPTAGWVVNTYFLLGFAAVAMVAHGVLRALRFRAAIAMALGVAYAFLPFHFFHGVAHLTRSTYATAPIAVLLVLWAWEPATTLAPATSRHRWLPRRLDRPRLLVALVLCVVIATFETMTAGFTIVLLVVLAAGVALVQRAPRRALLPLGLAGAIGVAFLVVSLPTLRYWAAYGQNDDAGSRQAVQSQQYGLRPSAMVLPAPNHRVPALAELGQSINGEGWLRSEGGQALGLVGAAAFAVALGLVVFRGPGRGGSGGSPRSVLAWRVSVLAVLATMVGVLDGAGTVVAVLGIDAIRVWNRIVVLIAFCCSVLVAIGLERLQHRLGERWSPRRAARAVAAVAVAVGAFAVWDAGRPFQQPEGFVASELGATRAIVQSIEATLPAGAMVFQLPAVPFPEAGQRYRMYDYDGFRPYLVSDQLRWSYGATRGRPTGDWQQRVERLHPSDTVRGVVGLGFEGLLLDRFGYDEGDLPTLEAQLGKITGVEPVASPDGRYLFWDLRPYRDGLGLTPEQLRAEGFRVFGVSASEPASP